MSAADANAPASTRPAPCTMTSMRPNRSIAASIADGELLATVEIRVDDHHVVALCMQGREALEQRTHVRRDLRIFGRAAHCAGSGRRERPSSTSRAPRRVNMCSARLSPMCPSPPVTSTTGCSGSAERRADGIDQHLLVALDLARAVSQRNDGLWRAGRELGEDLVGYTGVRIHVHVRKPQPRVLLGNHLGHAEAERARRVKCVAGRDLRRSARDQQHRQRPHRRLAAQRVCEAHRCKTRLHRGDVEIRTSRRRRVPAIDDPAKPRLAAAHLGRKPREMVAVAGIDDVRRFVDCAKAMTASHDENPDARAHQALRDCVGEALSRRRTTRIRALRQRLCACIRERWHLLPERPIEP